MLRTTTVLALSAALLAPAPVLAQESPSPSPTATGASQHDAGPSPSPTPSNCNTGGFVAVSRPSSQQVVAGETVTLTLTGKGEVDNAYARFSGYRWETPSRQGQVQWVTPVPDAAVDNVSPLGAGETATETVTLRPTTNTRLRVLWGFRAGCLHADAGLRPEQSVIDVAPRLTLTAVRNGVRDYTFSGVATTPGLIVNLYRVDADGSRVLTSQGRATDAGTWTIRRRFLGSGRFGFVVHTGRTMANAPGASSTRPTVIH